MWKRVLLVTVFVGLIGALVGGAVFRTINRTGQVVQAQGRGTGRGLGEASQDPATGYGQGSGGRGGQGRDGGSRGQSRGSLGTESGPSGTGEAQSRAYGSGGQGRGSSPSAPAGTQEGHAEDWVTLEGVVVAVDEDALLVQAHDHGQVTVEGRAWQVAQEQGFWAEPDDEVTLTGFTEDGEFKVAQLDNATNGQSVLTRDESGRPLWAGRGRWGN